MNKGLQKLVGRRVTRVESYNDGSVKIWADGIGGTMVFLFYVANISRDTKIRLIIGQILKRGY